MEDGVLAGVRVIEFGHYVSAPLVGVLLADQGAEVIRIDAPEQVCDDYSEAFLLRGKRRITLDLKREADLETARHLVASADVVVENFRPGVMSRLGLGEQASRQANSRLIYCELPGFAPPDHRARVPAWEGVVAAATANTRLRHAPPGWDTSRPTHTALPLASTFAASLAAYAIVSALTAREDTHRGEHIRVPLFNATFELIGAAGVHVTASGVAPMPTLRANGSGLYQCSDDRWVQFDPVGASARFIAWFLDMVGHRAVSTELRLNASDPELQARLPVLLAEVFRTRTAEEWDELAVREHLPLAMVRTSKEWMATEHAVKSGAVVTLADPGLGVVTTAGRVVTVAGCEPSLTPRELPNTNGAALSPSLAVDADGEGHGRQAVRPSSGQATKPSPPPQSAQSLHGGLRVLDLCQVLAGPTGARVLADFGADVVKINAPQRSVLAHSYVNRGKRSVLLDIESTRGQQVLWRLIERADVLTINFPVGTAERYGLGFEHVRSRNPSIVYVHATAFGQGGPWQTRRGYETQGQAATGMMSRVGGGEAPGQHGPYNILDFGTGVIMAYAASLGVHRRKLSGEASLVTTSLAHVGTLHQGTLSVGEIERSVEGSRQPEAGRYALGHGPLQRYYETADRWLYLGARLPEFSTVADALGLDGAIDPSTSACSDLLEDAFKQECAEHWERELQAVGVGCSAVRTLDEVMADPEARAEGLVIDQESDEVGSVTMPGPAVRLDSHRPKAAPPGRPAGADARSVLAEVGLARQVEALAAAWAVQIDDLPATWGSSAYGVGPDDPNPRDRD